MVRSCASDIWRGIAPPSTTQALQNPFSFVRIWAGCHPGCLPACRRLGKPSQDDILPHIGTYSKLVILHWVGEWVSGERGCRDATPYERGTGHAFVPLRDSLHLLQTRLFPAGLEASSSKACIRPPGWSMPLVVGRASPQGSAGRER